MPGVAEYRNECCGAGGLSVGFLGSMNIFGYKGAHTLDPTSLGLLTMNPHRLYWVALATGVILRLIPLFDESRLLQQWPTEDGYLSLTIARNFANGAGFSVADGTVLTNGTQPLVTALYAVGFWLFGGATAASLWFVQLLQIAFAAASCSLLFSFVRFWFKEHPQREWIAAASASVWILGPVLVPHSMNCLETGLVVLVQLLVLHRWYVSSAPMKTRDLKGTLFTGLLMGALAWSRIDSAFFLVSLSLVHLYVNYRRDTLLPAVKELALLATVTSLMIAPWLLYGKMTFGHWMPISGIAEGHFAVFAGHAELLPAKLVEYALPFIGVPFNWEDKPIVVLVCSLFVLAWSAMAHRAFRGRPLEEQAPALVLAVSFLLYGVYYGFAFGAPHFLSRYLVPVATLSLPVFCFLLVSALTQLGSRKLSYTVGSLVAVLLLAQQARIYAKGLPHEHFQVVRWVDENVPDDIWVGAIQTGTLGFYHPRTLNFDGKVDPRALDAKLENRLHNYIVGSDVQAIVDWAGVVTLARDGHIISDAFRVKVEDKKRNLAVLVRKGGPLDND